MKIKRCTKCRVEKPLTEFNYKTAKKDSRRTTCRQCDSEYKSQPEYKKQQVLYARNRRQNPEIRLQDNRICRAYGSTIIGRANRLFLAARQRARVNDLMFTISQQMIEVSLYIGVCERTGIPFDFSSPNGLKFNPYSPSIDKKNPHGGYTPENIQVVCTAYNFAKHQMTDEQFLSFCKIIVGKNK